MPAHDQSDIGRLERFAEAEGLRLQVEGDADTAADGDRAGLMLATFPADRVG
jgi:hypothetical protein